MQLADRSRGAPGVVIESAASWAAGARGLPAPPARPPLELLWTVADAEHAADLTSVIRAALGPNEDSGEPVTKRILHTALARAAPARNVEQCLFDSVDADGVLTLPIVSVEGSLQLHFEESEYATTLATVLRPFAEGDGELEERLDEATRLAEHHRGGSFVARELAALRQAWTERELAIPLEDLENEARRILTVERRFRTIEIFQGVHLVATLRRGSHQPLPVYLPEAARNHLPLQVCFDARMFVRLHPRQLADEGSPVTACAIALARLIHRN